jgi:spore germination cell wall hydrolase CwlJ-like protein
VKDGYVKGKKTCQFSWYCDGRDDTPHNKDAFETAQSVAWSIVQWDTYRGISEGATHYHTTSVNPYWNKNKPGWSITRIGTIGSHIYYRWNK